MLSCLRTFEWCCFLFALSGPLLAQDIVPAPVFTADLSPDMDNGTTIWDRACAACHGELGQGGHDGSDIRNTQLSLSQIMLIVQAGSKTMPAFAGFTPQQLLDVSTYVKEEL